MDIFDFEELVAEMLSITDAQREEDEHLPDRFYEVFSIQLEDAYVLAQRLLLHTVPVEAGLSGAAYHAFVSRTEPFMLMKQLATKKGEQDECIG